MLSQQRCRSWGTLLEKCSSTEAARPPETEAEYVRYLQLKIAEIQLRHLLPLKEDVTDWLNATLGSDDITVDNYMSSLDNGIKLCRLARIIVSRASQLPPASVGQEAPLTFTFKCWEKATSRSFFARDNVFNFLQFCRLAGCRENFLFETDGLVLHSQPRDVLLCLLELGRRSSRFIVPPCLVQLEQEIEQEQERLAACCRDGSDSGYSDTHEQRERSVERQLLLLRTAGEVGRTAADDPAAGAAGGLFKSPRPGSLIPVRRRRGDFKKMGSLSVPASATSSPSHHRSTSCLSSTSKHPPHLLHLTGPLTPSRIPRPSTPATPRSAPPPLNRTRSALQVGDVTDHTTRRLEGLSVTPSGRLTGPSVTPSTGRRDRRRSAAVSGEMASPSKLPTYRRASLYTPRASSAMSDASTVASATQTSPLDEKVRQTFADTQSCCKCQSSCPERKIQLQRLAEGQYMVAGRIVFIRLLKGRHVMVRVGGGWDTLEHFLTRHDPCRATSLPPSLESPSQVGETTEMFLRLPPTPRFRPPQVTGSDT